MSNQDKPRTTQEMIGQKAKLMDRSSVGHDKLFLLKCLSSVVLIVSLGIFASSAMTACSGTTTVSKRAVRISEDERENEGRKSLVAGIIFLAALAVVMIPDRKAS